FKGWGKLYFIPLGDFPTSTTEDLIAHYQSKYGLSIEARPNLPLKFSVVNTARQKDLGSAGRSVHPPRWARGRSLSTGESSRVAWPGPGYTVNISEKTCRS